MEEKIYFRPEKNNKTKNKKQTEQRVEKKKHRMLKLACLMFFLLVLVILIIWLMRGKTTTSGEYPDNISNESLSCISSTTVPPKIDQIKSDSKELRINAIFSGVEELKNISLIYKTEYADDDTAYGAEAKGHAEFNKTLASSNYKPSKFDNKFSRYDGKLTVTLFANKNELDEIAAPYFMLKLNDEGKMNLVTLSDFQKNYESQGFVCESTI